MNLQAFLNQLATDPASVTLDAALAVIAAHYDVDPCGYTLAGVRFEPDRAWRSCQLYAFGLLHHLPKEQTLACFGHHYQVDVLGDPEGTDHQTVRLFLKHGWDALTLDAMPLRPQAQVRQA